MYNCKYNYDKNGNILLFLGIWENGFLNMKYVGDKLLLKR